MDRRVERQINIKTDEERKGKRERDRQIDKQIEKGLSRREKVTCSQNENERDADTERVKVRKITHQNTEMRERRTNR